MITSPAFDILRQFKDVSKETEDFVMKRIKGKISNSEMISCFENGLAGQYGKVYKADPETILGWVEKFKSQKSNTTNYLSSGLLAVDYPTWEVVEWDKEANKCLTSFLNGVSESYFNPGVYDRMMVDGKIQINAYLKHLTGESPEEIIKAKQKVLRDVFLSYKSKGWISVYLV